MSIRLIVLVLAVVLSPVAVAAHPGHDPVAFTGTVTRILPDRVEIETFDKSLLQMRRIVASLDAQTKWKRGKQKIDASQVAVGASVVITMEPLDAENRATDFRALEVKVNEPKKKK
jgi:hypothetical protein